MVEVDGSTTVRKYQPGAWELDLELTYDNAGFRADNEQFIREYSAPTAGLTLKTLGYTYEQAYVLAGRHLKKVLELASPRDKGTRAMVQRKLSDLKAIDGAPPSPSPMS